MPNWRRAWIPGGTFFFTVVTHRRKPLFARPEARKLLGDVIRECQTRWAMEVRAIVLLPDHLHAIWSLPPGDTAYPRRWAWIKGRFTKAWLSRGEADLPISPGRIRDGRRGIWQPKYWEHVLEDETDFERHFDYIHYNPVKHGLVRCPREWKPSSFHRYVALGVYPSHWACWRHDENRLNFDDIADTVGE